MKSFNVLDRNLNVQESYLLEASAGTGKTFSIENIVCRLLVESDPPILIDQILVVTFTKAATSDLKTRIRQNIEKALNYLSGSGNEEQLPDYLQAIIEKDELFSSKAISHLKNALFGFDEAQIFTIHSFCSKMLTSHVLEGDLVLNSTSDEPTLVKQEVLKIIRNFFRTELTKNNFSAAQLRIVLKKHKSSIENVEKALIKWTTGGLEAISTPSFQDSFFKFKHVMSQFCFEKDKIIADFNLQISNYRKLKNHETGHEKIVFFASLFEKEELLEDDFDQLIQDGLYLLEALDPTLLKVKAKAIPKNEIHYPDFNTNLSKTLLPIVKEASAYENIFCRMVHLSRSMLHRYLKNEEKFRFDDLLKLMRQGLKNERFLFSVREKYRSCIIDEFQDTDHLQWEIFRIIFQGFCPFYLVGDPKQSIYSFRQADIYTYLKAAHSIPETQHLSLDTNYRSLPNLINSLNELFKFETSPHFIQLPKLQKTLDFVQVKCPKNNPEINFPDALGSLHFFIAQDEQNKTKLPLEELEDKFYFPFMAEQIIQLKQHGFKFSQMAILVKDHFQATRVLKYFNAQNIKISLQRLTSLVDSIVVQLLIELLLAVISPRDESALKTALGTVFIGFSNIQILSLKEELVLEDVLSKFYQFKKILYSFGFLKFLEAFLKSTWNGSSVVSRIMSYEDGHDLYDDLLQISDLIIEHQSETKSTPQGLIRFLKDFSMLNFDSDDKIKKLKDPNLDAIKTLTIHSSKGLEFDIVFAIGLINRSPTPDTFIPVQREDETVLEPLVDTTTVQYINLIEELDAEKSRQLYVAMTRAKYRVYVPCAFAIKNKEIELASASCMELFLANLKFFNNDESSTYERIQKLNSENVIKWINTLAPDLNITYSNLNEMNFSIDQLPDEKKVFLEEPLKVNVQNSPCYTSSFTQLAKQTVTGKQNKVTPHDFEIDQKTIHNLPSGAKTGILLHTILESLPLEEYEYIKKPSDLQRFVIPFLSGTKFESWALVFQEIIFNVLNCSLSSFKFKEIDRTKIYREKEFIFSNFNASGYIKGVIDLFFLHEGKYYFIDWKSNWLGATNDDYIENALVESMKGHDYYLQADIYSQAIKRFLNIVDARNFEDCFGGIFYIFLRGLDLNNDQSGILHFK